MRLVRPLNGISCRHAGWLCVLVALSLCGAIGCDTNGFVDPSELMRTRKDTLVLPILKQIDPGIEEADTQFANATDPLPEDHIYNPTDYNISPNDLLAITLSDVAGPNTETVRQARVSESGYISLPLIGSIKAAGLTEIELEDEIVNQYRSKQIISNATVSVTVIEARGRAFSVLGAVNQPGEYAIVETDFRLLNALVLARNVASPFVDYIYVIRRPPPPRPASSRPAPRGTDNTGGNVIPPSTGPTTQELAPPGASLNMPPAPVAKAGKRDRVVHLTADQPQEVLANQPASTTPEATKPEMLADETPAGGTSTATTTFSGFNNPDDGNGTRVIRVPYDALRTGNLNYNIPIRPHDLIYVPEPNVGVYYMAGHVSRPGVYTFNGQKVTLKQAIASAAMLDGIAIPQRTDIIRRVKPDHEVYVRVALDKIFAGEQPDIYLKPDDMVTVGTNMLAPFLAAVRGGFRITYGFGFLYDRNYAYSQNVAGGF